MNLYLDELDKLPNELEPREPEIPGTGMYPRGDGAKFAVELLDSLTPLTQIPSAVPAINATGLLAPIMLPIP